MFILNPLSEYIVRIFATEAILLTLYSKVIVLARLFENKLSYSSSGKQTIICTQYKKKGSD